jgi:hypothetical protein
MVVMVPAITPADMEQSQKFAEHVGALHRAGTVGSVVSLVGLVGAGVSFVYGFVVLAKWFVGPPEKPNGEQSGNGQ